MIGGVIVKDFEKMQKYLVSDFIFMLIINSYLLIDSLFEIGLLGTGKFAVVSALLSVILLIVSIVLTKKGNISGGVLGIIIGVLMILTNSVLYLVLGIFVIIHSSVYLTNYSKK